MSTVSRLELIDANELLKVSRRIAFASAERQSKGKQIRIGDVRPATDAEMLNTIATLETITQRLKGRYTVQQPAAIASRFMRRV